MNIKHPAAIDFYGGNSFPDLNQYNPVIAFLKASEGGFIDGEFVTRMGILAGENVRRGCYHFHRKSVNTQTQINTFVNICKSAGVTSQDVLVLDVEEGGETANQLQVWITGVMAAFPNNLVVIYSRKNILDPIATSGDYFKQFPVWTAGYPYNPDLYDTVPAAYIPDQTRWGPVWCWQYADTSIGVDLVLPEFMAWLGNEPPPIDPPPSGDNMDEKVYDNGVTVITGTLNECNVRTVIFPYSAVQKSRFMYFPGTCVTADTIDGFDYVCNLTPFNVSTCKVNLGLRIGGTEYEPYHNYNPYLALDGSPLITHVARQFKNYQTASQLFRYIIENGTKNPNANSDWDNSAPRRLVGTRDNGDLVVITAAPLAYPGGWTLHQACDYGLSLGLNMMCDGDSGRSTHDYLLVNGEKEVMWGTPYHDGVPAFLTVQLKEPLTDTVTPPPGGIYTTHVIDVFSDGTIAIDNGEPF